MTRIGKHELHEWKESKQLNRKNVRLSLSKPIIGVILRQPQDDTEINLRIGLHDCCERRKN